VASIKEREQAVRELSVSNASMKVLHWLLIPDETGEATDVDEAVAFTD